MSEVFKPLADKILVRRLEAEDKTPGGILLPDRAREKPLRGRVLAVGPGKYDSEGVLQGMNVRVGDVVVFGSYAGHEFKLNGEQLLILREDDVHGKVVTEPAPEPKAKK